MAKKLIIETEAKTDGLDKAIVKLGELKDLGRGLKIQYDVDNKPLEILVDNALNASQKVKVLTAELRKTKEGTAEFGLLNSKLKESQDDLTRINAKSRDLFASFSLIPGPIGDIFGKLNGVIGLLKTFSGFTIKDFGNQFKEFGKDITGIFDAIFGLNKEIDQTTSTLQTNTDVQDQNTESTDEGTVATNAGTVANQKQTTAIEGLSKVEQKYVDIKKDEIQQIEKNISFSEKAIKANLDEIELLKEKVRQGEYTQEQVQKGIDGNRESIKGWEEHIAVRKEDLKVAKEEQAEILKGTKAQQSNTAAITQNTGAKEVNTAATAAYTAGTEAATFATTALNIALKALGIGLIIGLVVGLFEVFKKLGTQLYDTTKQFIYGKEQLQQYKDATSKNIEASETARNKILEVGVAFEQAAKGTITKKKALEIYNEILGGTIGDAKTLEEAEKLYKDNTAGYIKSVGLRAEAQELFALAAKQSALASQVELQGYFEWFFDFDRKLGESAVDKFIRVKGNLLKEGEDFRNRAKTLLAEALEAQKNFKPKDEKKPDTDTKKIENDNKAANDLLLKLQQENTVQSLNIERKKQDSQLKIDKENEEREIKNLKLSKDKEELRGKLLEQVRVKYAIKVIEINKKRQEEDNKIFDDDQKKLKDYQDKIFEIINNADENELSRNKASRARKFEDDKEALQKDANFQKQSLEEKIRILMALEKGYKQDIQKLDDDEATKTKDKASKKLDDELKFLQIRGEALREGTKQFFNNQRDILKTAEKKELNDLQDRAIAEKLTTEQVEAEKLAIKQKYAKERSDIDKQELDQYLQYATTILSAASSIFSQISQVNALEQQVASERLTKAYIEQNELDKKNITNKEQQEKKLLENKKKFAKDEDDLKRKAFEDNKKIQIAQAIIGTLQGAVQAYQSLAVIPVVGPALGAVAAAAALVFGYKQVDLIKKTTYQSPVALADSETPSATTKTNYGRNYAKGGMIGGKRHAEGGTMIEAEQGEAIMTRGAVTMFAPLLSMMNQAGGGTSFNSNLMTTRQDNPIVSNPTQEQAPLIVKTYVVSQELTTEAQRQARLKNLSTI